VIGLALEALKRYAIEQQQATQAEIDNLLKNDAQKRPTSDEKGKSNIKPLVSKENVAEGLLERLAAAYKKQQENVKKSERLRAEVNKSIQAGEPVYKVLLKAIECISLMTGDKVFYNMNKDYLQTIYGILGEPAAIEIEKQEVKQRLTKLMAAYKMDYPEDERRRIKNAIKAHQEKLKKLEEAGH